MRSMLEKSMGLAKAGAGKTAMVDDRRRERQLGM
jgi:hypothetical protein